MSAFPFISNFQGDFLLQLVVSDVNANMDEVAESAAYHSVGRRVAPQPGKIVRVRKAGEADFFPRQLKVADSGLKPMDCLEFIFANPE
ncbi:MAG: toluene monooxygenase [Rhodocyclaceae bacterium]|nr:MAG: toluene monooxygenase [Rhodocyclaceae bacterium]